MQQAQAEDNIFRQNMATIYLTYSAQNQAEETNMPYFYYSFARIVMRFGFETASKQVQ